METRTEVTLPPDNFRVWGFTRLPFRHFIAVLLAVVGRPSTPRGWAVLKYTAGVNHGGYFSADPHHLQQNPPQRLRDRL